MQLNIDQIKQDLCRQMSVVDMIEQSAEKAKILACSSYYGVFGTDDQRGVDVAKQNSVTQRLVNYLAKLREEESA